MLTLSLHGILLGEKQRQQICLKVKCVYGFFPSNNFLQRTKETKRRSEVYFRDCLLLYSPVHSLQSSEKIVLDLLPLREVRGMVVKSRDFSVVAPALLNSLLFELASHSLLDSWKELKAFLFQNLQAQGRA